MNPKSNQSAGGNNRPANKSKISNYSLVGLATALCGVFFLHNQLLASSLLGGIDDVITVILMNLAPVVAVVLSFMGIKDRVGRSDISRMMGWVGLVFGLGGLIVSILFSYSLLSENSVLGIYDQLLEGSFF